MTNEAMQVGENLPPAPFILVTNPAWELWIERVAIETCDGHGPSPCMSCLRAARDIGRARLHEADRNAADAIDVDRAGEDQ